MARVSQDGGIQSRRHAPAMTPEDREQQFISLAMDLTEKRLREGTASSQEIVHFLKLATVRSQLENAKLRGESELLKAKVESIESGKNVEQLYRAALDAMRSYGGGFINSE